VISNKANKYTFSPVKSIRDAKNVAIITKHSKSVKDDWHSVTNKL